MSTDRLIEAAVAVLSGAGGELQTVNLNKALFYFDLAMLRDMGRTYTGTAYVALKRGPVVNDYKVALVRALEQRQLAEQTVAGLAKPIVLRDGALVRRVDIDVLAAATQAGEWAKKHSAEFLSDYSHGNPGWEIAHAKGEGTRINMVLAMQQVVDVDPWMESAFTGDELEHLRTAEFGTAEPF